MQVEFCTNGSSGGVSKSTTSPDAPDGCTNFQVGTVMLYGVPIVSLNIDNCERLCLAQISNTLLKVRMGTEGGAGGRGVGRRGIGGVEGGVGGRGVGGRVGGRMEGVGGRVGGRVEGWKGEVRGVHSFEVELC